MTEDERKRVTRLVETAFESGVIDRKTTLEDAVKKLGPELDQVAGYVVAWERYVLVVASELADEVVIRRPGR